MSASRTETVVSRLHGDSADTQRLAKVRERTGLSRSTIYRLISRGAFPGAVQLTTRAIGWRKVDIDAWLKARPKAAR
ncbi:MAG TPA: AlpA family phage regulatory protein [Roseateles sp.]|uniref:helix-turn-helix transcriptional regulator n=1 Tax=Roseateles sp. TaxID=1971397 RepID=UPI002EDAEDC4